MFECYSSYGLFNAGQGRQDITDWIAGDCKKENKP
jgi:hypothetical protein